MRPFVLGIFLAWIGVAPVPAERDGAVPEAVEWLQDYLQIDTTNPPGGERAAAAHLAEILEREGIESRLLTSPGGRTSLYARVPADAPAAAGREAIVLIHHIDVVPANGDWRVEPFSGRPLEGKVWGRGAIDTKSLGIAQIAAVLALKRAGIPLRRDVILLAVADEEQGGLEGTGWLLDAHPELFAGVVGALNEGGSNRVIGDRLIWWGLEVTQKRPLWLRVTAGGRGGHASGFKPSSATHQLVLGLARLIERPLRFRVSDAARSYFGSLAEVEGGPSETLFLELDQIVRADGSLARDLPLGVPVYFLDTVQVTEIQNGRGSNVVAPEATASIDIRLLPDTDSDAFLDDVRQALGPEVEVEVVLTSPEVAASPTDHPLYRALTETLEVRAPVVSTFIAGTTDARFLRARGIPVYGFMPFTINPEDLRGIHAPNEQIPRGDFLRGIETLRRVVRAWAGVP